MWLARPALILVDRCCRTRATRHQHRQGAQTQRLPKEGVPNPTAGPRQDLLLRQSQPLRAPRRSVSTWQVCAAEGAQRGLSPHWCQHSQVCNQRRQRRLRRAAPNTSQAPHRRPQRGRRLSCRPPRLLANRTGRSGVLRVLSPPPCIRNTNPRAGRCGPG